MSTRISSALFCLLVAGCGPAGTDNQPLANTHANGETSGSVDCAPAGAADFAAQCTIDRAPSPAGLILTLHNPDGAFHRLLVTKDGRGVIAADGAEPARVTLSGADAIEVAIGGDRYRLPATIGPRR